MKIGCVRDPVSRVDVPRECLVSAATGVCMLSVGMYIRDRGLKVLGTDFVQYSRYGPCWGSTFVLWDIVGVVTCRYTIYWCVLP